MENLRRHRDHGDHVAHRGQRQGLGRALIIKDVQEGIEASNVAKLVHKVDELRGDAGRDARDGVDSIMASLWCHQVIKVLIEVIILDDGHIDAG